MGDSASQELRISTSQLLVRICSRTNAAGVAALRFTFPHLKVVPLKLGPGGLHLKSGGWVSTHLFTS